MITKHAIKQDMNNVYAVKMLAELGGNLGFSWALLRRSEEGRNAGRKSLVVGFASLGPGRRKAYFSIHFQGGFRLYRHRGVRLMDS